MCLSETTLLQQLVFTVPYTTFERLNVQTISTLYGSKCTGSPHTIQQYKHLSSNTCDILLPNKEVLVRIYDTYFIARASSTDGRTEK